MEALDRANARAAQRLDPNQVLKPVEVHSLADIKRLVAELDPRRNPPQLNIPLATTLDVTEDNNPVKYRVEVNTRSKTKRDMLVEGLGIIKSRTELEDKLKTAGEAVEVNGVPMKPAQLGSGVEGRCWVDPLIRQWLGGYRDGTLICWNLQDGFTYRYDIFQHKLTRVEWQA
jgi:hypothetical protein